MLAGQYNQYCTIIPSKPSLSMRTIHKIITCLMNVFCSHWHWPDSIAPQRSRINKKADTFKGKRNRNTGMQLLLQNVTDCITQNYNISPCDRSPNLGYRYRRSEQTPICFLLARYLKCPKMDDGPLHHFAKCHFGGHL